MKLEREAIKDYDREVGGQDLGTGKVGMSTKDAAMFYEITSKFMYSNVPGSIVRELTSNCYDAHVEARRLGILAQDEIQPVIIKGGWEEDDYYIYFIDKGTGMNPERWHEVYLKYMESSKRETNDELGMWGLGSKSPFAYTDVYHVVTIADGIKYHYIMSKGVDGIPDWDLIAQNPSTEHSGTTIKFIIEGGRYSSDYYKFQQEIIEQLRYFDDVYVEDFDVPNEYQILELDTFKYREADSENQEMHIVLGKVTYPIDWKTLKRPAINIPIGAKFAIGELFVTPNREQLRYNDDMVAIVNKRVDECLDELKSLAEENLYEELNDLVHALTYEEKKIKLTEDTFVQIFEGNYGHDRKGNIIRYPFYVAPPTLRLFRGTPIEVPRNNPFFIFRTAGFIERGYYKVVKEEDRNVKLPRDYENVYKMSQMFDVYRTSTFVNKKMKTAFIQKGVIVAVNKTMPLRARLDEIGLAEFVKSPFGGKKRIQPYIQDGYNKTKLYKLYKAVMFQELKKISKSYDALEVPDSFAKSWKEQFATRKKITTDEEIAAQDLVQDQKGKEIIKVSSLKKKLVIYSSNADKAMLKGITALLAPRRTKRKKNFENNLATVILNLSDFSKMTEENHVSLGDFMSLLGKDGKRNKLLIEQATGLYIYSRWGGLNSLETIGRYIPAVKKWKKELDDFMQRTTGGRYVTYALENSFVREILSAMEEEKLFIQEYIDIMDALEEVRRDLALLKHSMSMAKEPDEEREIASFIVKKGYLVDPIYVFYPNAEEAAWIETWKNQAQYTTDIKKLYDEAYNVRRRNYNANYSLYNPLKECQVNYPNFGSKRLPKLSMLQLREKTQFPSVETNQNSMESSLS
jgi:hypothetical protein